MKGGPLHLDESAVQYKNLLATDRANTWQAHGGRRGILDGGDVTPNAVELGVDIAEFDGLVQATISGAPRQQGWYVWNDASETVLFDTPSADPRVDALVCAVRAPDLGTIPGGTVAGPQWVTVAGTPAASNPQPPDDATIDAAVGPGGWFRRADVAINPGDTVVAPGNITVDLDSTAALAYARIEQPGGQATGNGALEQASFNTVIRQNRSGFGTAPSQLTIPHKGYYVIQCVKGWDGTVNTGNRHLQVQVDGVCLVSDAMTSFVGASASDSNQVIYSADFDGGEVITAWLFQDSGVNVGSDTTIIDYLEIRQQRN